MKILTSLPLVLSVLSYSIKNSRKV